MARRLLELPSVTQWWLKVALISHPDTPKNDWRLNDLRGVLEVQVPIGDQIIAGKLLATKIIALIFLSIILTLIVLYATFKRKVSNRLTEIVTSMEGVTNGNGGLSQRLKARSKDEIGAVRRSFNTFIGHLEDSFTQVGSEVNQLVSTSQALQSVTQASKQNIATQQTEIEQVSAAMVEMTAAAQEVASLAERTAANAHETESETKTGQSVVAENMQSVQQLSIEIANASEVVSSLETDSQNIGGVLDVIRGIAEQTNLLALNAAIEAARAGEQGRGFAVVADEVRTLASRTQASTDEIQQMITQLQEGAKRAVHSISKGNESIEASLQQANKTTEVIDSITNSIAKIRDLNIQIATAAAEQTSTSTEMDSNINAIAGVAAESTQSSSQVLESADQINVAVKNINDLLGRFSSR